jgi:hypothetical protein
MIRDSGGSIPSRSSSLAFPIALLGVAVAPIGALAATLLSSKVPMGNGVSSGFVVVTMLLSTALFMWARRLRGRESPALSQWSRADNLTAGAWVALLLAALAALAWSYVPLVAVTGVELIAAATMIAVRLFRRAV